MAGRRRIPIEVRKARGDTNKIGRLQFNEQIASAFVAQRGRPPLPVDFEPFDLLPQFANDTKAVAQHATQERRRMRAREHWEYLCTVLESENLLCPLDQGIIAGMAWTYALMTEAAEAGASRDFAELNKSYMAASNLTGLNECARTKVVPPKAPEMSAMDAALAEGLPSDVSLQ